MAKIEQMHQEVLRKIMSRPSEMLASQFEEAGYSVDFSNKDIGEEPVEVKEFINNMSDEELGEILTRFN